MLGDTELLREHLEGIRALDDGDSLDLADVADQMRAAGRPTSSP